jgi:hypothetical protein
MKELLMRAWLPKSEKDYWKKPFLLLAFSLVLLLAVEVIKANKETTITLPDDMSVKVDSKSRISFDAEQYAGLVAALNNMGNKQPIIVKNELAHPTPKKVIKKPRKKRWHKAGYY